MIKKFIPNFITLLNLLSGCIALVFISNDKMLWAFYFVCLGIIFDFFDGFFARILQANSALGLQLDSLADMVTSGLVPGFATYMMITQLTDNIFLALFGFFITLGAAYRLAKFNVSTNQTDEFIGLPTPANTLLVMGFLLLLNSDFLAINYHLTFLILLSILSGIIQNGNFKLFSLKMKAFSFKSYPFQFVLLICSIILLIIYQLAAIPFIILFYIFLSIIKNSFYAQKTHKS